MPTLAVDFDGVIHRYSKGWQDGSIYDEPVAGAFPAIKLLMERYAVFVHTTRNPVPVANWIAERSGLDARVDVPGDPDPPEFWDTRGMLLVTNRKLPAVAYVDDRAIRFESWPQACYDLDRYEARRPAPLRGGWAGTCPPGTMARTPHDHDRCTATWPAGPLGRG